MKRTNSMRVAVAMLALTLITSCFVGGTFAKYTTSASGGDSARVAKFGVKVGVDKEIFKDTYDRTEDLTMGADFKLSVDSDDGAKVVAPGTKGKMTLFTISGNPEVAVRVGAVMNNVQSIMLMPIIGFSDVTVNPWEPGNGDGEELIVMGGFRSRSNGNGVDDLTERPNDKNAQYDPSYYPIKWKLTKTAKNGSSDVVAQGQLVNIQMYLDKYISGEYAPNTLDTIVGTYTLEWEWGFETGHDGYDTILGNIAAGEYGIYLNKEDNDALADDKKEYNLTEAFDFSITVTQID